MTRFFLGIVLVAAATLIIFEWKTFGGGANNLGEVVLTDYEHEIIPIVVTKQPQQEMPPPSENNEILNIGDPDPKVVIENPDPYINPSDTFVIDTFEIEEPDPPVKPKTLVTVEKEPCMMMCKDLVKEMERRQCTSEGIFAHLNKTKRYPSEMKKRKVTGTVYVEFVIDEHGKVISATPKSKIKDGTMLEKEAVRMVRSLPRFVPATQQGQPVRFKRTVPISFILR